ncbi:MULTISPECIES: hypothetical protein [unclassified Janthinobacterium]|uniref:hypothetical protein n=1 Tax=unclassified Janthinobacterium TaxID=2610881 RepID=UPI0010578604|nr:MULTISPECIES: hypothetical protein [unclassified Janthinobacterium]
MSSQFISSAWRDIALTRWKKANHKNLATKRTRAPPTIHIILRSAPHRQAAFSHMKACAKETFTSAVRKRKSVAAGGPGAQSHFSNAAFS